MELPYSFARRFGILCFPQESNVLLKCKADTSLQSILEAKRFLKTPCEIEFLDTLEFDQLFEQHYHAHAQGALSASVEKAFDLETAAHELQTIEDLLDVDQEAPIIRLINALIAQALKEKTSDIHIETYLNAVVFRMRTDGILKVKMQLPAKLSPLIISRIKIMSKLNIAEKRLPQDGRMALQLGGRQIDVRVSTLPSNHGERIVLRLLDKQATPLNLNELGLCDADLMRMRQLKQKPHGIILVTGPTGAGKTTTLYALLNELNDHQRNILTIEDPVEYELPGIGQSQVNAKIGMTFARGLRAILRQDPDIVMVGEIRDLETAEIAIQASLTGHLMLSTLHTNTAIGAITRLTDMGVPSYLIASTLEGIIAQRLFRLLCPHCKQTIEASESIKKLLKINSNETIFISTPKGCSACDQTGYRGRKGIYEIIIVDEKIRNLIHTNAGEQALSEYAHQKYPSIHQAAIECVLAGEMSLDEMVAVVDVYV